jgi:hypothetical protein
MPSTVLRAYAASDPARARSLILDALARHQGVHVRAAEDLWAQGLLGGPDASRGRLGTTLHEIVRALPGLREEIDRLHGAERAEAMRARGRAMGMVGKSSDSKHLRKGAEKS